MSYDDLIGDGYIRQPNAAAILGRATYVEALLNVAVAAVEAEADGVAYVYALHLADNPAPVTIPGWTVVPDPVVSDRYGTTWLTYKECETAADTAQRRAVLAALENDT
jgi:hypothetical protein